MSSKRVNSLSVVLLLAQDTARTAAFYQDVLELELAAEEHDGRPTHYACRMGSVYFTIQHAGDFCSSQTGPGPDSLQLCFSVPDILAFLQHLKQKNVEPLHPPVRFEHTTFVTLRDPDG